MTIKKTLCGLVAGIILMSSMPSHAANPISTIANGVVSLTKKTLTAAIVCAGAYGLYHAARWYFSTIPARNINRTEHNTIEVGQTPPPGQTYNRFVTLHYREGATTKTITVQAYVVTPNDATETLFKDKIKELMKKLPRELRRA